MVQSTEVKRQEETGKELMGSHLESMNSQLSRMEQLKIGAVLEIRRGINVSGRSGEISRGLKKQRQNVKF